jgi:hypothetical protein
MSEKACPPSSGFFSMLIRACGVTPGGVSNVALSGLAPGFTSRRMGSRWPTPNPDTSSEPCSTSAASRLTVS